MKTIFNYLFSLAGLTIAGLIVTILAILVPELLGFGGIAICIFVLTKITKKSKANIKKAKKA